MSQDTQRLRADFADAWHAFRGHRPAQVPEEERSRLRRAVGDVYYSDTGRRFRADALDAMDAIRGRRDPRVPPRRMHESVGDGDFFALGEQFRGFFVELGGLERHHDVLDVGSGIGRMAIPLADWLTGSYEGFDIVPEGIEWCRTQITPRHPNFRFQLADLRNEHYNPDGRQEAHEYDFPYGDASFDFVFLTSIFTHLMPAAHENYMREIARVLRPGGRCFASYFLLDEESRRAVAEGRAGMDFSHDAGGCMTIEPGDPERAVAYDSERLHTVHEAAGLPMDSVHHGTWSGRDGLTWQDLTVSTAGGASGP